MEKNEYVYETSEVYNFPDPDVFCYSRFFSCYECGQSFVDRWRFVQHITSHISRVNIETKAIPTSWSYIQYDHEQPKRGESRGYVVTATRADDLYKNQIAIFSGKRNKSFRCERCDKLFSQKYHLVTHRRTHTGERPYVCTHCSKGFSQKTHLKAHLNVHTDGFKSFRCSICGKGFARIAYLRKHFKFHHVVHFQH